MINLNDYFYDINLEYDDFDIPVEEEWCEDYWDYSNDSPEQKCGVDKGILYRWIYNHWINETDYIDYFKKNLEDITEDDLDNIDEDDFYEFLLDRYYDEAYKDAQNNWEKGLDSGFVDWDSEDDYWPDYEED